MAEQWQCWCGEPRGHGGNKKIADFHSRIAKAKHEIERFFYPHLFEKPVKQFYAERVPICWVGGKPKRVVL